MASLLNMSGRALVKMPYDAEIAYLESTGTQWIDTRYTPIASTRVDLKYQFTDTRAVYCGFGICVKQASRRFHINIYENRFHFGCGGSGSWRNLSSLDTNIHEASMKSGNLSFDGASYSIGNVPDLSGYSFYLFKTNDDVNPLIPYGRLYSISFYENENKILDFIPVRIGQVGYLYDKVRGALFGNSGTGSFILGPDKTN